MVKFFAMLLILLSQHALAAGAYNNNNNEKQLIREHWQLINSPSITVNELNRLTDDAWQKQQKPALAIDDTPQGQWFLIKIPNNTSAEQKRYFVIPNNIHISKVKLYQQVNTQLKDLAISLNNANSYVGSLTIPANSQHKLLVFIKADAQIKIPAYLYHHEYFLENYANQQLHAGIAVGGLICLALIELLWFFASGFKSALLLTAYFICKAMLLAILSGWNVTYLLPEMDNLRAIDIPILVALSSAFYLWFIIELFNLSTLFTKFTPWVRYFCWLLLLYIPLSFAFSVNYNIIISFVLIITASLLVITMAYLLLKREHPLALLLVILASLQLLFTSTIAFVLLSQQPTLMQYYNDLIYSAFWINGLFISFLLSRQFYFESRDKAIAQQQALENSQSSQQAQAELLRHQQESQEMLEQHVQERTLELNIALQELEQANRELERKNTLDELTGLNNRRFYDQKILAEYRRSKRNLTPLSLVLIDIDHFKNINDTYGHLAGDHCLQQLAQIIKQCLKRSTDIGCRYGGEEFCLILPDTDTLGAIEFAEHLRQKVSQSDFTFEDIHLKITISCGVSTYKQQDDATPEDIFAAADKALYEAKHKGRNQTWHIAIEALNTTME